MSVSCSAKTHDATWDITRASHRHKTSAASVCGLCKVIVEIDEMYVQMTPPSDKEYHVCPKNIKCLKNAGSHPMIHLASEGTDWTLISKQLVIKHI